jgi:hypothetical protein
LAQVLSTVAWLFSVPLQASIDAHVLFTPQLTCLVVQSTAVLPGVEHQAALGSTRWPTIA